MNMHKDTHKDLSLKRLDEIRTHPEGLKIDY